MNITQMIEEVRSNAHEVNETFLTDTEISRFLNRAQRRAQNILSRTYEEFFHSVDAIDITGGTNEYDLPEDIVAGRVQNVDISYNNELYHLEQISINRAHEVYFHYTALIPTHFAVRGNKILIYPTPSLDLPSSIKLTYTKRVTEMGIPQGNVVSTGSSSVLASNVISSVNKITKTFTLNGTPDLSGLQAGDLFVVAGSTLNNGNYTIVSFDDTLETITVSESIPDDAGALGSGSVSRSVLVLDTLGDGLEVDSYISICSPVKHLIRGSYQIDTIDETSNTITIKSTPDLDEYRSADVSGSFLGVSAEDIVILAPYTAVSEIPHDYHDYMVYYATVEVLKKAKEPIDEFQLALNEASQELENAKADRLSFETVNMTKEQLDYGD